MIPPLMMMINPSCGDIKGPMEALSSKKSAGSEMAGENP